MVFMVVGIKFSILNNKGDIKFPLKTSLFKNKGFRPVPSTGILGLWFLSCDAYACDGVCVYGLCSRVRIPPPSCPSFQSLLAQPLQLLHPLATLSPKLQRSVWSQSRLLLGQAKGAQPEIPKQISPSNIRGMTLV